MEEGEVVLAFPESRPPTFEREAVRPEPQLEPMDGCERKCASNACPPVTPTPAPPPIGCTGDCDANGEVTIEELTRGVSIALGADLLSACPVFDINGNAEITIDELIQGISNALSGCLEQGASTTDEIAAFKSRSRRDR